jgi:hypothetical protein
MTDTFDLERFVTAQEPVFDTVLSELRAGRKRSHWMWLVFPQLRGLGRSSMAEYYGISSLAEARAYLAHPVLGARLDLCTRTVLENRPSQTSPALLRRNAACIAVGRRLGLPIEHGFSIDGCDVCEARISPRCF